MIQAAGQNIKLQIWDTAGQETFKSITRSYYRGSIGGILVYDVTNRESFANLARWLEETRSYSNDKISLMLVGNKSDLADKRVVSQEEGAEFAKRHQLMFVETSAKTNSNVELVFSMLTEKVSGRVQRKEIDPTNESLGIKIGTAEQPAGKPRSGSCC